MRPEPLQEIRVFLEPRHFELAEQLRGLQADLLQRFPLPHDDAEARIQARALLASLGSAGLIEHLVPREFGGTPHAPDLRAACLIRESVAAVSPLGDAVFALQGLGSLPITLGGTQQQKEQWLPRVAHGSAMAAFAMTEENAGSDAAGMTTQATPKADGFRLNGSKTLISNAGIADFYCVFAVTDTDSKRRRISCLLVPAETSGVTMTRPLIMSAPHPLGVMSFDQCDLTQGALLGNLGEGMKLGLQTLDRLRPTVAAAACGMAQRALDEALAHAKKRQQFGEPLAHLQLVQAKLAKMAISLTSSRLMTYRAAWEADQGKERITVEASMAKAYATESAQKVVDDAIQILGGRGVLADHPVDHLYRSVRALRIYEGTTDVQYLVIARHLLG